MINYTIAEKLFIAPAREVFSGGYFGYSLIHESKSGLDYQMWFSLCGTESPFIYDLKRHGLNIDVNSLNIEICHPQGRESRIEMIMPEVKSKDGRCRLRIPLDCSAAALLIESYRTNAIGDIKEHLIDLIRNAIRQ
jgi:hypothetical protein